MGDRNMVKMALWVRLEAKPGKEKDVATFLEGGLPIVQAEPATTAWFAIRLGPSTFGIFDAFPDEAGRQAHLSGKVAAALKEKAAELFAQPPTIEKIDVLAAKLPVVTSTSMARVSRVPSDRQFWRVGISKSSKSARPVPEVRRMTDGLGARMVFPIAGPGSRRWLRHGASRYVFVYGYLERTDRSAKSSSRYPRHPIGAVMHS